MAKKNETAILIIREVCGLIRRVVPWVVFGWLGWCVVLISQAFAGQLTIAQVDVLIRVFDKISSPVYPWALALGTTGYGYLQRRERRRTTERLQRRITDLEQGIDPDRSSSGLNPDGSASEDEL